jgi:hypothetical protein
MHQYGGLLPFENVYMQLRAAAFTGGKMAAST